MSQHELVDLCKNYKGDEMDFNEIVKQFVELDENNARWLAVKLQIDPLSVQMYAKGSMRPVPKLRSICVSAILSKFAAE